MDNQNWSGSKDKGGSMGMKESRGKKGERLSLMEVFLGFWRVFFNFWNFLVFKEIFWDFFKAFFKKKFDLRRKAFCELPLQLSVQEK